MPSTRPLSPFLLLFFFPLSNFLQPVSASAQHTLLRPLRSAIRGIASVYPTTYRCIGNPLEVTPSPDSLCSSDQRHPLSTHHRRCKLDAGNTMVFGVFPSIFLSMSFSPSRYRCPPPSFVFSTPCFSFSLFLSISPPLCPFPLAWLIRSHFIYPPLSLALSLFIPIPILILLFWSNSQSPV